MQRNCGVLAYDKLVGELNGRSNVISMDTLAKLATDNGFLLYPTEVPVECMTDVPLPCIIYTDHHFEVLDDLAKIPMVCMSRAFIYLLTHELINPDWVMKEREAKGIRGADIQQMFTPPKSKSPWEAMTSGSTGGWAGFAGPSKPTNPNDPKGWGWVGPLITGAAGMIPGVGPLISAGLGAAGSMNNGTGFQGTDKGWGNLGSTLGGAALGYGMGSLGAGVGQGVNNLWSAGAGSQAGTSLLGASSPMTGYSVPAANNFASGFGAGVSNYFKPMTNAVNNLFGGSKAAGAGAANPLLNSTQGVTTNLNTIQGGVGGAPGAGTVGGYGTWNPFGSAAGSGIAEAASGAAGAAGGASGSIGLGFDLNSMLQGLVQQGLGPILGNLGGLFGSPEQAAGSLMELPEVQAYAASIGQAKTELGQMGRDELARVLSTPIGEIIPDDNAYFTAMMRRTEEAAKMKKQQVTSNYNAIGRANSSEHMQALAEIDTQLFQAKQDLSAVIANEKIKLEMDYRISALSGALGIDKQAASELAGLTNLSVVEASLKYGLSAAEVAQLRAMLNLSAAATPLMGSGDIQGQGQGFNLAGNLQIGG